jgi:hypothetical protein
VLEGSSSADGFVGIVNDASKIVRCEEIAVDGDFGQARSLSGWWRRS